MEKIWALNMCTLYHAQRSWIQQWKGPKKYPKPSKKCGLVSVVIPKLKRIAQGCF